MSGSVSAPLSRVAATSREQIYSALFNVISGVSFNQPIMGWTTWAGKVRKFVDPAQIPPNSQPFLSQFEGFPERYMRRGEKLPPVRDLGVRLFCYARVGSGDPVELGSQYLTTILEAVEEAMQPDDQGEGFEIGGIGNFTLGGLVRWCRIEGNLLKVPGDTDSQGLLCIPIKILWP
jgi:hypothetical protein